MDKLEVFGARKLNGHIIISGSKNASLPILAATILSNKKIHLSNIPKVKDIETMIKLLKSIGSKVKYLKNKNSVLIQKTFDPKHPEKLSKTIEELEIKMFEAAKNLEFEEAAKLRDEITLIKEFTFGVAYVHNQNLKAN